MKITLVLEEELFLKRTAYTLAGVFLLVALSDFAFSRDSFFYIPTLALLASTLYMIYLIRHHKERVQQFLLISILVLTVYFSFMCHYFYLDLMFIPIFCLLFFYAGIFFRHGLKFMVYVFIVLNILLLMFLYRERKSYISADHCGALYIMALRIIGGFAILILFYFSSKFLIEQRRKAENKDSEKQFADSQPDKKIDKVFEAISRRDKSFMQVFMDVYPDFLNHIDRNHIRLSQTELEICGLIKLGLTTKEIAIATNSTYKAIESAKYRIRKKMNLDSGTNMMLFLNSI